MRTLVVVGGVGFKRWENMCRLNCVGVEKSEYINVVGVKKWLKKTAFRCKKVEAKKGYPIVLCKQKKTSFTKNLLDSMLISACLGCSVARCLLDIA